MNLSALFSDAALPVLEVLTQRVRGDGSTLDGWVGVLGNIFDPGSPRDELYRDLL